MAEGATALASGLRLGAEWELVSLLGKGGFGEVWKARHLAFEDRLCAAKIPLDRRCQEILRREGIIQHRLEHPHIVRALGLSLVHDPPYFLMELMSGGSLREELARGPMKPVRAWEVLSPVLLALEHAHSHGIVHRDLKPESVLLDDRGVPKLTDFGLGRASRELEGVLLSQSFLVTNANAAGGTLEYMAPEQRRGREPDARADLYSFGVLLYESLVGERPVGRFAPPSTVRPELPRVFDKVALKALAPEPDRRFPSASALLKELREGLVKARVIPATDAPSPVAPAPEKNESTRESLPAAAAPSGARTCPRCRLELRVKLLSGIELDACEKCHGLWFDPNELESLVAAMADKSPVRETVRIARRFLEEYGAPDALETSRKGAGACVICGSHSAEFVFLYDDRSLRVDRCLSHGAWLDWESQVALKEILSTTKGVSTFLDAVRSLFGRGER
ncbi:protein kinase [bacterium]|nr:protein kinase [bacterium]